MSQRICATAGWDCCSPAAAAVPWRAYWGKTKEKTQKMIEIPACVWYNPTIHIGGAMLRPMTAY